MADGTNDPIHRIKPKDITIHSNTLFEASALVLALALAKVMSFSLNAEIVISKELRTELMLVL